MNKQRVRFVESLLCVDLKKLIEWNRDRDPDAKRKLIQYINLLYTRFPHMQMDSDLGSHEWASCSDDAWAPSSLRSSKQSSSNRSRSYSLTKWLTNPKQSSMDDDTISTTTGSFFTDFTELSATTFGSIPHMCPMYSSHFQNHKRSISINRREWNTRDIHRESRRCSTRSRRSAERRGDETSHDVSPAVLDGVYKPHIKTKLWGFVNSLSPDERELFVSVTRAIRGANSDGYSTTSKLSLDHVRDCQIWTPAKSLPFLKKTNF